MGPGQAMPWSCGHAGSRGAASGASQGFSLLVWTLRHVAGRHLARPFCLCLLFCGMTHGDTRVMFWVRGDGPGRDLSGFISASLRLVSSLTQKERVLKI